MPVDKATEQQNDKLLGDLLDKGDKKFVSLVGIVALGQLAAQLDAKDYKAFLDSCIDNAHEFQKHKALNAKAGKEPDAAAAKPE